MEKLIEGAKNFASGRNLGRRPGARVSMPYRFDNILGGTEYVSIYKNE